MTVYVYDHETGKVVPKGTTQRDRGPGRTVPDEMPHAVQSMADGKWYTSRSALRATYRASGNPQGIQYTEVGNDPARLKQPERRMPDKAGIVEAIRKAAARFNNGERY